MRNRQGRATYRFNDSVNILPFNSAIPPSFDLLANQISVPSNNLSDEELDSSLDENIDIESNYMPE